EGRGGRERRARARAAEVVGGPVAVVVLAVAHLERAGVDERVVVVAVAGDGDQPGIWATEVPYQHPAGVVPIQVLVPVAQDRAAPGGGRPIAHLRPLAHPGGAGLAHVERRVVGDAAAVVVHAVAGGLPVRLGVDVGVTLPAVGAGELGLVGDVAVVVD